MYRLKLGNNDEIRIGWCSTTCKLNLCDLYHAKPRARTVGIEIQHVIACVVDQVIIKLRCPGAYDEVARAERNLSNQALEHIVIQNEFIYPGCEVFNGAYIA